MSPSRGARCLESPDLRSRPSLRELGWRSLGVIVRIHITDSPANHTNPPCHRLQNHPRRRHLHQRQSTMTIHRPGRRWLLRPIMAADSEHGESASLLHPQPEAQAPEASRQGRRPGTACPPDGRSTSFKEGSPSLAPGKTWPWSPPARQSRPVERHRLNRALPGEFQAVPQRIVQGFIGRDAIRVPLIRKPAPQHRDTPTAEAPSLVFRAPPQWPGYT